MTPNTDELLAHSDFIRAIAYDLLRDRARADDVVQETMLAAVRRPPRGRLRPWLAAVARKIALSTRRSERRRGARELAAAQTGRSPSTAQVVADLEVSRLVVEAVRGLDEPYRSALFLRYFHAIGPSEIAARENVSVRTVESRLRRGREKVRAQLEERPSASHWAVALAAMFPPKRSLVAPALAASGIVAVASVAFLVPWNDREPAPRADRTFAARPVAVARPETVQETAPIGDRDSEWRDLLSELATARMGSLEALQLRGRVAQFLGAAAEYRAPVIDEISARDSKRWFEGAILAAGAGLVPDEALADNLARLLDDVVNRDLRDHIIAALGANRHGQPRDFGVSNSNLTGLGTPVLEPRVRAVLLELLRSGDPARWVLLAVLSYSQDLDGEVAATMLARAQTPGNRTETLFHLAKSRRADALDYLRAELARTLDRHTVGAASFALLRTGVREDAMQVLDVFRNPDLEVESAHALLQQLAYVSSPDPMVRARKLEVLLQTMEDRRSPRLQFTALNSSTSLLIHGNGVEEAVRRMQAIAVDARNTVAVREMAVTALGRATHRSELAPWLIEMAGPRNPAPVRRMAIRYWVRHATPQNRAAMRAQLNRLPPAKDLELAAEIGQARKRLSR